ncbi:MFS transporter [Stenotrophomonas ginsengisoli]|nr:MFS transporter [Stenotrophomonas ginsengisoli]
MKPKATPYFWVSYAMIVGVMGTALISPLYALYKELWQLKPSDISLLYVIYMGGALAGLLFLGRLPDRTSFLRVMQAGLLLILLGTVMCLLANNLWWLGSGRFLVGIASTLLTTSATKGLALLAPAGSAQRVAMLTGFLMALGFGLGPLTGGIIGQWLPQPLVSAYLPTLVLGLCGWLALRTLALPATAQAAMAPLQAHDFLPQLTLPTPENRSAFWLTTCLPFMAFAVFGLYAAMSPLFLDKLVPWHGPVVSGSAIALILFVSAIVQVLVGRLPTYRTGTAGLLMLALSNALLMVNLWAGSALLFVAGVLAAAIGHAMCMLAGMSLVPRLSELRTRSGLFSTYLLVGYIGSMLPMLGIGAIADHWGMRAAVTSFCIMVIAICALGAPLFWRHRRIRQASQAGTTQAA